MPCGWWTASTPERLKRVRRYTGHPSTPRGRVAASAPEPFEARPALPGSAIESGCAAARERGLLEQQGDCWVPTARGRHFLNDLQALFLPERPAATGHHRHENPAGVAAPVRRTVAAAGEIGYGAETVIHTRRR